VYCGVWLMGSVVLLLNWCSVLITGGCYPRGRDGFRSREMIREIEEFEGSDWESLESVVRAYRSERDKWEESDNPEVDVRASCLTR
jgi:hypothetical protein